MFGKRKFQVIPNSINVSQFDLNQEIRQDFRKQLGLEGKKIFGTVGRVTQAKNPYKLIDIFEKIHKIDPETVFLHVGDGDMMDEIRKVINSRGLKNSYLLLGRRVDISQLMNAMDCFMLPSIYEGFPIVLIEAQCSGLPCLVSDNITKSCNITGNVQYLNRMDRDEIWAKAALEAVEKERTGKAIVIREKGYDIVRTSKKLENFFLK